LYLRSIEYPANYYEFDINSLDRFFDIDLEWKVFHVLNLNTDGLRITHQSTGLIIEIPARRYLWPWEAQRLRRMVSRPYHLMMLVTNHEGKCLEMIYIGRHEPLHAKSVTINAVPSHIELTVISSVTEQSLNQLYPNLNQITDR
jgi:hypothetical protein